MKRLQLNATGRSLRTLPVPALVILSVLLACAPGAGTPELARDTTANPDVMPTNNPLASTLHAESFGDSVRFSLRVTNTSSNPVPLTFASGQSFDFVVLQEGREIWRWSADQMFTQAIREETLAPEQTREYTATWSPGAATRGEFEVRGILTAQQQRVEQQTRFRFP